jgi:hypothetical protein
MLGGSVSDVRGAAKQCKADRHGLTGRPTDGRRLTSLAGRRDSQALLPTKGSSMQGVSSETCRGAHEAEEPSSIACYGLYTVMYISLWHV